MAQRKVGFGGILATLLAIVFAAAALFHAAAIVFPNLARSDSSVSPVRHGVFVAINVLVAAGLALHRSLSRRVHAIFTSLFALLCLQQLWSHGTDAWRAWTLDHRIDIASLGVLVVMPLTLVVLLRRGAR